MLEQKQEAFCGQQGSSSAFDILASSRLRGTDEGDERGVHLAPTDKIESKQKQLASFTNCVFFLISYQPHAFQLFSVVWEK